MNSQYETLYGVGLLDDLHNYFPAVLYQPSSFQSVPDLLVYLQSQARNRFDLFSLGHREYQMRFPSIPPPPPSRSSQVQSSSSSVANPEENRNSTLSAASPPLTPPLNSTHRPRSPPPLPRTRTAVSRHPYTSLEYIFNMPDFEEETTPLTSRLLLSLLSLPIPTGTAAQRPGMDAFLQPVPVFPSPEEIAENTTLGTIVSDEEHPCAICQDALQSDQEGRKLNACNHWFHKTCIDTWFQTNVHCPVCRHDIREQASD